MERVLDREVVEVHEAEPVGLVGIADQCPGSVRDEHLVMTAGHTHRGEVRQLVAATPRAGPEVVDVQSVADLTARDPAMPIAQEHRTGDLG